MPSIRQVSFAAGELSPFLYGRTDLELHAHGARKLLNFVINRQGAAVSRPGTRWAWNGKTNDIVLIPFLHSDGGGLVVELGHLYARVYDSRTLLQLGADQITPFQTQDLAEVQWAQVGSTLVLAHPRRPAQELTIDVIPSITPVRYAPLGDTAGAAPLEACFPSIGGNPPAMPVLVAWTPLSLFVVDAAHPPREWRYKVSTLVQHRLTGQVLETLPRDITHYVLGDIQSNSPTAPAIPLPADNQLILFDTAPIYIEPGMGTPVALPANWIPIENIYYRGRGSLFGYIGRCAVNGRFADFGAEPNYLNPPLRGDSPFRAGEYPSTVAYFQQRRAFGGPSSTWRASAVDQWTNFDEPVLNFSGQPLAATLVNRKREKVVAMVALEHLLVFTDTSVWCVGRNEVPLDFDTFPSVVRVVDEVGALPLQPLVVDGTALYARAQGHGVRSLQLGQSSSFDGADISWQSEHLFRNAKQASSAFRSGRIISWCYQREPWGAVWAVRDDGVLLSCTRTGSGTWAWARHDLGGDEAISITSVPNNSALGTWDELFLAVRRGGVTRVERMTPGDVRGQPLYATNPRYNGNPIGSEQLSYPLDSYVVATITVATGVEVAGLGHLEGRDVWLSCPGIDPLGPLRVTAGQVTSPAAWGPTGAATFKAAVGLQYTCDLELLDAAPGRSNQKTIVSVGFECDSAQGVSVGEDFEHLTPWRQRAVSDSYEYPSAASAFVVVMAKGSWRRTGRAVLRQDKPLPVTVLGVTRELDQGGT